MVKAKVKWIDHMRFIGHANSKHAVVMDSSEDNGGLDTAIRPMELLLVSLGGCTGMDVVAILRKMRVPFTGLEIEVEGTRRETPPRIYTRVQVTYRVIGKNLPEDKVKRAVELSWTRYCSVTEILRLAGTELHHKVELVEPVEED